MEISEQSMMSLNVDNFIDFKPKKGLERLDSKNLEIDVDVNEEDEQLFIPFQNNLKYINGNLR